VGFGLSHGGRNETCCKRFATSKFVPKVPQCIDTKLTNGKVIGCVALTGIVTLPWVIALMFCITDIKGVLSGPVGTISPLVQLMHNTSGGAVSTTVGMTIFFLLLSFLVAGPSSMTATSRIIWSFAREGGFPKPLAKIGKAQQVPVNALLLTWLAVCLLSLIYIGNSTAFYGLASGVTVTLVFSYAMPIFINVIWGIRHNKLKPGPFTLGRWSRPINFAALAWSTYLILFLCFPTLMPVNKINMNYASLVFGFGILLPTVAWFAYGKKRYLGVTHDLDPIVAEAVADIIYKED
jgi:choline transport protein